MGFDCISNNWIISYLKGRSQTVIVNNISISEWKEIFSGVSQGSVLGPFLFPNIIVNGT